MNPATPHDLRAMALHIDADEHHHLGLAEVAKLRLLADLMEQPFVGPSSGDIIARFLKILTVSIDECQGRGMTTVISPDEARSLHAAILKEGFENAEAMTKAGLAAVRSEDRANEMAGLVDEQARLIGSLRQSVLRLTDLLKQTAEEDQVEVKFVFVPSNGAPADPQAMGVGEAMDLALALDVAK